MKVCYIIMPFENADYLIRCVNSLYRQSGANYEVILAENVVSKSTLQFLDGKTQIKRISGNAETTEEKLAEAVSLISSDCEYVQLLDVTTVIAPICTKSILKLEKSELIIPKAAIKTGNEYTLDCVDNITVQKRFDSYSPLRFCYSRALFNKFLFEDAKSPKQFSVFLITVFSETTEIRSTEDVCMYATTFAPEFCSADFETVNDECEAVFVKLFDIVDIEARVVIFEKILNKLFLFLGDESIEICRAAFDSLQKFSAGVQNNFLFRSLFESKVGFEANDFLVMSCEEYLVYKEHVYGAKNAVQNKLLNDMKEFIETAQKEIESTKKEVVDEKHPSVFIPTIQNNLGDLSIDIPNLYCEGRLGFKTIWKSFWGWLRFKFNGKK